MIYFIQAGQSGAIKIGYSKDRETLKGRLSGLQTSCPAKLNLLGVIPETPLVKYIYDACGLTEVLHIYDFNNLQDKTLDEILSSIEINYIKEALQKTKGLKEKAAELLGISFRTFRYRVQKYDL